MEKNQKKILWISGISLCLIIFIYLFFSAPADFPRGAIFRVEHGNSLRTVSLKLKEANIIRSRTVFEALVIIFGREKGVIEADYYLENKFSVYEVARRLSKGEHRMAPVVVTIPEGFNIFQIADSFASKLTHFNKDHFIEKAKALEGSLFPDTYYFLITDTETEVIESMSSNFEKKMQELENDIAFAQKSEKEIIIMASLIEGEAKGDLDRGFISGILWKRLSINMPLQVDAAPETYKKRGLPKIPIGNPGLESIKAAIHPTTSNYLYYIHDKDGDIHYARNFIEHRQNVLKYLK